MDEIRQKIASHARTLKPDEIRPKIASHARTLKLDKDKTDIAIEGAQDAWNWRITGLAVHLGQRCRSVAVSTC